MCGIVAAIAQRPVWPILLEGLRRLEYRGYDSAGLAVLQDPSELACVRSVGKVDALAERMGPQGLPGLVGIAHTRWATHGVPAERNAHPHIAGGRVAVVHNGIIENHAALRAELQLQGRVFSSDTDTEVIAHMLDQQLVQGATPEQAFHVTLDRLHGAFALAILMTDAPDQLFVARLGSPLVIGVGIGELFAASDALALLPVTQRFIYLAEGDRAILWRDHWVITDRTGEVADRAIHESTQSADSADRGGFKHFMLKEIHEQPRAIADTLEGRISEGRILPAAFGVTAEARFAHVERVQIVACGTSYHAGMVARYWFEDILRLSTAVEVSSEFHYRNPVVSKGTLLVMLSQSGETADTLAALRYAREKVAKIVSVVNVPTSSIARESDLALPSLAGVEIGVASTKAFTCQLTVLAVLALKAAVDRGRLSPEALAGHLASLAALPGLMNHALGLEEPIATIAAELAEAQDILFLGRGAMFPLALEGALKLKEISYIHAEGYASGELKHGPIALIDSHVPVIVMAPRDGLFDKTVSNMQEVMARGGKVLLLSDGEGVAEAGAGIWRSLTMPSCDAFTAPILYALPAQLLAYHTAIAKGTDVDQPRNLAKSVTVE